MREKCLSVFVCLVLRAHDRRGLGEGADAGISCAKFKQKSNDI